VQQKLNGPYAFTNQPLADHLQGTAQIADKFVTETYASTVSKRLYLSSQMSVNIKPDTVKVLIRRASLLHDVGKAADRYQSQFERPAHHSPTFYLHEVPSAIVCDRVSQELELGFHERFLLSFTVLNHMNSFRPLERICDEVNASNQREWSFVRYGQSMPSIFNELGVSCNQVLRPISYKETRDFIDGQRANASKLEYRWIRLYCMFLSPVIAGDNLDAQKRGTANLSPSRLKFIRELGEASNLD
jgi:CRISPR-associated endonuclease Cas3-HD